MSTTAPRRIPALLTALTAGALLFAGSPPSHADGPITVRVQSLRPALPTLGASSVVCKLGQALIEEYDAQFNLRSETYRDEIETASAASGKHGLAKG